MKNLGIEVLLSSDSQYEKLTAEIFYNSKFVALLSQDDGVENLKIEFPSINVKQDMIIREMDVALFEKALGLAKKKLLSITVDGG